MDEVMKLFRAYNRRRGEGFNELHLLDDWSGRIDYSSGAEKIHFDTKGGLIAILKEKP